MKIIDTKISGVHVIETDIRGDDRGSFARAFCARDLEPVLQGRTIAQINHSRSVSAGTLRGMHFQKTPFAEMKMVRCLRGRVWDVALDLRKESPTFMQWHAEELTPETMKMVVIPERCAHGFQTLESDSEMLYLHTEFYEPSSEGGVNYADPHPAVTWPLPPTVISPRDAAYPLLTDDFAGI